MEGKGKEEIQKKEENWIRKILIYICLGCFFIFFFQRVLKIGTRVGSGETEKNSNKK